MADAWLEWNDDFKVSASGGLLLATGDDASFQNKTHLAMAAAGFAG